jgi:hypothetical protein
MLGYHLPGHEFSKDMSQTDSPLAREEKNTGVVAANVQSPASPSTDVGMPQLLQCCGHLHHYNGFRHCPMYLHTEDSGSGTVAAYATSKAAVSQTA